jgi:hypothetical protein
MHQHLDQQPLSESSLDAALADVEPRREPAPGFAGSYLELMFGTIDHAARARTE